MLSYTSIWPIENKFGTWNDSLKFQTSNLCELSKTVQSLGVSVGQWVPHEAQLGFT